MAKFEHKSSKPLPTSRQRHTKGGIEIFNHCETADTHLKRFMENMENTRVKHLIFGRLKTEILVFRVLRLDF